MRVLMFGWEFPPFASGGLGTACEGIVKGLAARGENVIFVAPKTPASSKHNIKLISANDDPILKNVKFRMLPGLLTPYMSEQEYHGLKQEVQEDPHNKNESAQPILYGKNLFQEVHMFSERARQIARKEQFDVIHAHDWLTFSAGIKAKEISRKPLVVHVHATEFDRTGGNGINQFVYNLEKEGMEKADRVITVSNYTKNMVVSNYGIDPAKIDVVHNAVEFTDYSYNANKTKLSNEDKIVLFLGRITLQKGPDYFIYAAKRVIDMYPNVKFVIAGSGDMEPFIIEKVAELGISDKVLFAGFLKGADVDLAYRMADLYVMPSVSEPFGITPLEALRNNVPVMISKQSGVSEVLQNALKVDFWDIDEMANKMINVLRYGELREELRDKGSDEVKKFSWLNTAGKCVDVYNKMINDNNIGGNRKW
ncbi:MAG: glycosyltransferase family 4 protein [Candidatus Woesearchaeota archaeon]|nr:glycosyltransferase family 4 protein [Candidatus Woesearchaeota archaeon]